MGFSFLLLERGFVGFNVRGFIRAILRDVTLFVTGETAAFRTLLINILWAVALALPWVRRFRFAERFLSARVSIAFGSGDGILTFKILAKSAAENPANCFWGVFLGISPWMSLIFWTA